jgi:site-specific recombinase XerD
MEDFTRSTPALLLLPAPTPDLVPFPALAEAVAQFLQHRRHAGLSPESLALYDRQLAFWLEWRGDCGHGSRLADVTIEELRAWFTYLQTEHVPHDTKKSRNKPQPDRQLAPATIQGIWRTLHAAWNYWMGEEYLSEAQALFFVRGRIPKPRVPETFRPVYDPETLSLLLEAAAKNRRHDEAARDRAILLLLSDSGMRVGELCGLRDDAMDYAQRQAVITGKGEKQRYIFWTRRTSEAIAAYLGLRRSVEGVACAELFRGCGSKNSGRGLTPDAVRGIVDRLAAKAIVETPDGAPVHALRHGFAHRFLDQGGDGLHLQQLLGHTSMTTTQRYVRENPTGLRRAFRRVFQDD